MKYYGLKYKWFKHHGCHSADPNYIPERWEIWPIIELTEDNGDKFDRYDEYYEWLEIYESREEAEEARTDLIENEDNHNVALVEESTEVC